MSVLAFKMTGRWCKVAALLFLYVGVAAAQFGTSAVHILPHSERVSQSDRQASFRSNVDLVLVNVTVLDHSNRAVTGLHSADFSLLEDKRPQAIKYFSSDDQPLSLAIVLDTSESMAPHMDQARQAALELVRTANPLDEISLVTVGDKPSVVMNFGDDTDTLSNRLELVRPRGRTALWDAMFLSLNELNRARYQRRAMVVISDGGDNRSVYTERELKTELEEADVELYAVGLFDRFPQRNEERRGPRDLDELASTTGGRLLSVHDGNEMKTAVAQIDQELRNEYVIGYAPAQRDGGGKWRSIKVALKPSAMRPKLRLYAKKGYYADTE